MSEASKTKVVIGPEVRFSYANVWEARAIEEGQTPKYSSALLISKDDKKSLAKIDKAIKAAIQEGVLKFGASFSKGKVKLPLRDGDEEKPDHEEYQNVMFFNASSVQKPQVVDKDVNPIMDQDEFYSGCYGMASVNFYPFSKNGNKGVAAGLNNVMKVKDGDKLSGGSTAAEDFGEVEFDDDDDLI